MASSSGGNSNNAFIDPHLRVQHSGEGPLNGLTFAAKDLFDVSTCEQPQALWGRWSVGVFDMLL